MHEDLKIRLSDEQIANLGVVAKLAGVKKETVIKVLLALFVVQHPQHRSEQG